MEQETPQRIEVLLTSEGTAGRVAVDLDAFVRFSLEMENAIRTLEDAWTHYPPAPLQTSRRSGFPTETNDFEA